MDKVALSMVPTGQPKSTQKSQTSWGKGGHLGCSDSFNFNLYKPVLIAGYRANSQGREEMHYLIDACGKSLRLMSYEHYMIFMRTFLLSQTSRAEVTCK